MIVTKIKNKIAKSPNGGRLKFIYLGRAEKIELYNHSKLYELVDMSDWTKHKFDGLEIVFVAKDSHLEVN